MIISCPSCDARYVVDPGKIGPDGRRVKCAKCGHTWAQTAPPLEDLADDRAFESEAAPDQPDTDIVDAPQDRIEWNAPEPENSLDEPDETEEDFRSSFDDVFSVGSADPDLDTGRSRASVPALRRERRKWPTRLAWMCLALVVGGTVAGFIAFQKSIVTAWPASKKLYVTVGLTTKPAAKEFWVRSFRHNYLTPEVLRIEGELENLSDNPHDAPNIQVLFIDDEGSVVKTWIFAPPERHMLPDEVVKFSTEIRNPPATAKRIDVGVEKEK